MPTQDEYQLADHLAVEAIMDDVTLAADLGTISTWHGFKGSMDELDEAMTIPIPPPLKPAAGASWTIRYPREVEQFLGANVRARRGVADLIIRIQPLANPAAWKTTMEIASKIKKRWLDLASPELIPIMTAPVVPIVPSGGGWFQGRVFLAAWMGAT